MYFPGLSPSSPRMKPSGTVCGEKHFLQAYCGLLLGNRTPGAQGAQYPQLEEGAR